MGLIPSIPSQVPVLCALQISVLRLEHQAQREAAGPGEERPSCSGSRASMTLVCSFQDRQLDPVWI